MEAGEKRDGKEQIRAVRHENKSSPSNHQIARRLPGQIN
jgi:hypothetical protein